MLSVLEIHQINKDWPVSIPYKMPVEQPIWKHLYKIGSRPSLNIQKDYFEISYFETLTLYLISRSLGIWLDENGKSVPLMRDE
jgi:hypothetical protein